jgi:hypothetical protein
MRPAQNINTRAGAKKKPKHIRGWEKFPTASQQQHKPKWKIFRKLQKEFSCHYAN